MKIKRDKLTLHAGQRKLIALPGRFKIAICGRRWGKTTVGAETAKRAAETGARVAWISPTDDQCFDVYTEVKEHLSTWHAARNQITDKKSGGIIRFVSARKLNSLRGPGWDLVIIDEAADVSELVWKSIILPTLLERDGQALLMGTPRGKANWLHGIFERANNSKQWSRLHAPTKDNPRITLKQLESMRAEMTELEFRQEFDAEFCDSEESIFKDIEEHISGEPRQDGRPGVKYGTGIDLGQLAFCVCSSINPRTNVFETVTRWNKKPWAVNEATIRKHLKRFPGIAFIDATGVGSKPAEDMDDIVRPFVFTTETRERALRALAIAWENDEFKICNHPQLIHELRGMEWRQEGDAPHTRLVARATTEFSDCVMSLALGWYARTHTNDAPAGRPGRHWFGFA